MKYQYFVAFLVALLSAKAYSYKVGVGRADCTGPPVEIRFMGYANVEQQGTGLHLRQFARAFIMEDENQNRVVFVSVDSGMMSHAVKRDVVAELQKRFGSTYNINNVIISGTHTHGTPGGHMMHLLYDISILGFVIETKNAFVTGITNSIVNAHNNMQDGRLFLSETEVEDANANRSPTAYANNPAEERAMYNSNTDKKLIQLRFMDKQNSKILGAINWFAVHPTSMNMSNTLVTSDNMGYASVLLEQEHNSNDLVGSGDFVGAFSAANLGDVSPNIKEPICIKTGLPCDPDTSRCEDRSDKCIAFGPGRDMVESTKIIANRIYSGASGLLQALGGREITGGIKFIHQFVDMPNAKAFYNNSGLMEQVRGCLPAMGYSFAAGTTDGPGTLDFDQSETTGNILWNTVRNFIATPTRDDEECQAPKPILLATGRATFPYEWQPKIVPTQIALIGDLVLAALPGEFTTMSGRRMRRVLTEHAKDLGHDVQVIIAGLSNIYTSYITTPEEYKIQRYEGASTIYGPHTLTIYLEKYRQLLTALFNNVEVEAGPNPPNLDSVQLNLNTPVVYDGHPIGKNYGDCLAQPFLAYSPGETVYTRFQSGNPRNNHMLESSFFYVEKQSPNGEWQTVVNDAFWETRFIWERTNGFLGYSETHFYWEIPENFPAGTYRIKHMAYEKSVLGRVSPYHGYTNMFNIVQ